MTSELLDRLNKGILWRTQSQGIVFLLKYISLFKKSTFAVFLLKSCIMPLLLYLSALSRKEQPGPQLCVCCLDPLALRCLRGRQRRQRAVCRARPLSQRYITLSQILLPHSRVQRLALQADAARSPQSSPLPARSSPRRKGGVSPGAGLLLQQGCLAAPLAPGPLCCGFCRLADDSATPLALLLFLPLLFIY